MAEHDPQAFYEKLRAFEGQRVGAPDHARDPVNAPMIRHWCDAVEDRNPVYTDPQFAERSVHGGIVAPPTMLQAWTMRGLRPPEKPADAAPGPQARLFDLLDEAGFTSVVAVNCSQEYERYLRPGDDLTVTMEIEKISPEKQTALGTGHFIHQLMTYRDQSGEVVGRMRFRLLKFRPREAAPSTPSAEKPSWSRLRPAVTRDGEFHWKGLAEGKLLVQRCSGCGRLRHPPEPACRACRSLEWEPAEMSGRGSVYSFVVMHHPPVPPFDYPNPIGLVELEEGPRLVARLVGVEPDAVKIGMPVVCEIVELDPGFHVASFRPAEE
ncbi:MAG: OB-fold domain-containing protein [Myxococcota bacterium]|nr:OB-fold domain-containing protein [Myxococcota bacterium]